MSESRRSDSVGRREDAAPGEDFEIDLTQKFPRCRSCGALVDPTAEACPRCGARPGETTPRAGVVPPPSNPEPAPPTSEADSYVPPEIERTQVIPIARDEALPGWQRGGGPPTSDVIAPVGTPWGGRLERPRRRRRGILPFLTGLVVLLLTAAFLVALFAPPRFDWASLTAPTPTSVLQGEEVASARAKDVFKPVVKPTSAPPTPTPEPAATKPSLIESLLGTRPTVTPAPGQPGASAKPTPSPPQPPTPSASPTPTTRFWLVANTGGDGVYIRRTPKLNDHIIAWPDRTRMEDQGEEVQGDGTTWRKVKDPRGNVGYIPTQYLVPAT